MKSSSGDQILFTFTDLKHLFLRHRSQVKWAVAIGALAALFLLLLCAPKYKSEATFRQSSRQKDLSVNMKEVFQQFMDVPGENGIMAIMQSNEVIKEVVEQLGMQVECSTDFFVVKAFKRIWDNLRAEFGGTLSDPDKFIFRDVEYSGEKPLKMYVKLTEKGSYQLYDQNRQFAGEAPLGEKALFSLGGLRVSHVPHHAKIGKFYTLVVHPIVKTAQTARTQLKIHPHRLDKSILQLTFFCRDRLVGSEFLNRLMLSYQNFLIRENDVICQKQLDYLQKRQEELTGYYDKALMEHAAYLNENLSKNGFIGFAQEIQTLSEPKNFYTSKLFDVDLDLKRLRDSKGTIFAAKKDTPQQRLQEKKNKDMQVFAEERTELETRMKNCEFEQLKSQSAAIQISNVEEGRNEAGLVLQDEFSGLSLSTAQGLLVEYTRQRDNLQAQMRELVFLREQLGTADFEMSSLGGVFDDAVTRDIVNKASAIALQLKDENNRSTREQERLLETLQTQKNFLSQYLFQTVELKRLRVKLLADKIASLQQATLSLLENEKDLLKHKLGELNAKMGDLPEKWRRESLLMLQKELGAMMLEGVSQLVETKSLGQHTFQISSKPLDKSIPPISPHPKKTFLLAFLSAILSGICYYFVIFCKALFRGLPVSDETLKLCGFPVSGKVSPYCNTNLCQLREGDLETLRCTAEFLTTHLKASESLVALCIGGKYPDFSSPLAELLAMRGLKVLVVQCVFDKIVHPDQVPGLWQYLQGLTQEPSVQRHSTYDILQSGGTSRHGSEILSAPRFQTLLSELKKRYDLVLVYSSAEPAKMEGFSLLKMADAAIIAVQQESKENLEVYCDWATQKGSSCATFVYAEEFG